MGETYEDPSGRRGYRSYVKGLRLGVNAEDYRRERNLPLEGPIMRRVSEIASAELARGRSPKETMMLEDVVGALREAGHDVENDIEKLRRRLARDRRNRDR